MPANFAVIVLAAGLSTRFGDADKLMADLRGKPVVAHVLEAIRGVEFARRIVVTREDSEVAGLAHGFEVVVNSHPEAGMGGSIALGALTLDDDIEAVLIALGDMPFVTADACRTVTAAYEDTDIVVPVYEDRQGHPVLFGRACFDALRRLSGHAGARSLMASFRVRMVAVKGTSGLIDLDTPDDFAALLSP